MIIAMFLVPSLISATIYELLTYKKSKNILKSGLLYFVMVFPVINTISILISAIRGVGAFQFSDMTFSYVIKYSVVSAVIGAIFSVIFGLKKISLHIYKVSDNRNGDIELWRFLFCVAIVIFHFGSTVAPELPLFRTGRIGVEFFFLVSGFLMAKNAEKTRNNAMISNANLQGGGGKVSLEYVLGRWKRFYPEVVISYFFAFILFQVRKMELNIWIMIQKLFLSLFQIILVYMSGLNAYNVNGVTWYLSALLLSSMILFPLLLSHKDLFINIIAPLLALFCMGYYMVNYGTLTGHATDYRFIFYTGMIRAIGEMSLGCSCYSICEKLY